MGATRTPAPPASGAEDLLTEAERAYQGAVVDPARYRAVAAQVVRSARRAGQVEAVVVALRAQAWAEHELLDNTTARVLLDRAVRLAREHALPHRLCELLLSRAAVRSVLGQFDAAQRDLDEVLALTAVPTPELLLQQATLLANRGRLVDAAPLYRRVLDDRTCPPQVTWKVANNLAMIEGLSGRPHLGVRYAERASALATGLGPVPVAIAAQTRAWVTVQAGRLGQGLALFEQAGALYRQAGLPPAEHWIEYADALVDLRLLPEALGVAQQAADLLHRQRAPLMAAEAELRLARLRLLSGDAGAALTAAARAARLLTRQQRTTWAAQAVAMAHDARARRQPLTARQRRALADCAQTLERDGLTSAALEAHRVLARVAREHGDTAAALCSLERAVRLADRAPLLVRVQGRLAAAEHAELTGDPRAVVAHAGRGLRDLARHRAALPTMELRALASGHGAELGTLALRALVPHASAARVFAWMERTRAAALLPVQRTTDDVPAAELATLRALHADLDQARRSTGTEPPELVRGIADAELALRRASWAGSGAQAHLAREVVPASQVRQLLDGEALVEYGLVDGRVLAAVVGPRRVRLVDLGSSAGVEADVEALLFALRRLARPTTSSRSAAAARSSAEGVLRALRARLVAPLGVDPTAPLVVVPVGALQRVPWSPLHDGPVTVAPSAASWVRTRQAPRADGGQVALVAGPDLPGAVEEVQQLAALHQRPTVLVPPDSTVPTVLGALRSSSVAHLACHGRVRADNPTFSSLLLSDGPLTVHELGLGGAVPHRIVLAACDSGVQVSYPGDESLGFVSALLAAGTAGVLASSVLVPDVGALPLLRALHLHLQDGATLAAALHAARAGTDVERPEALVSWCAFVAYGAA